MAFNFLLIFRSILRKSVKSGKFTRTLATEQLKIDYQEHCLKLTKMTDVGLIKACMSSWLIENM